MEATEPQKSFLYDVMLPKPELIYSFLSVLAAVLLWSHMRAGKTLSLVGVGGLAIVYYLKAFEPRKLLDEVNFPQQYFSTDNSFPVTTSQSFFLDTLAPKVMYISGATVLIGMLFKLMFWKGGVMMLLIGVSLLAVFIFVSALNQRINRRVFVVAVLGGLLLSMPEETLIRQLHSDDPQLIELMITHLHHPQDRAANEALRVYLRQKRTQR
ncbi:hypothetical protein GCM10022409_34750 [Hymenobacter glaciei]|uniref:Gliding motility protein GldL-like N-terminal domain-containing protein n=1 Tax=Hymenobacter glaciei TaxID=877209 RepID=A0ABP7UK55_9BACT